MKPYEEATNYLLSNLESVCDYLFPDGKREGINFVVGNIEGLPGRSFSIALEPASKRGLYKDFADLSRPASRNLCKLWKIVRGIPEDNHARFFSDLSAYAGERFGWNGDAKPPNVAAWPDWPKCLLEFSDADAQRLAAHPKRQFKLETIKWLHAQSHIGVYRGQIAFAMRDADENVIGVHRWIEQEGVLKFIKSPTLMVVGNPAVARILHIHESTWDKIAMIDRTGWHLDPNILSFSTRGVNGAKLVTGRIPPQIEKIYIWEQRDPPNPKTGVPPNEDWQAKVFAAADGRPVYLVRIPEPHKDLNDWTVAGATAEQISFACDLATLYRRPTAAPSPPGPDYSELPENFPPAEERPCYRTYLSPIKINDREYKAGLYLHEVVEFGDKRFPRDTWISGPLLVLAKTATIKNRNYGRLLEYHASNGVKRNWAMPMELLAGDGLPVLARLLDDGLEISHQNRRKVLEYLSAEQPSDFLRCATRTGWYSPTAFVLTEEIITSQALSPPADRVWFQAASKTAEYLHGGEHKNWRDKLGVQAVGNNYLVFAISLSLCGPLLLPLRLPGIGIHFYGDSTTGKTSVSEVGASSWGHGHDFLQTWNLTANGIETVCVEHTDTFLALDEIKEIEARDLDRVAYSVVNGQGKIRSDRSGTAKSPHLWRVVLFSTGEYSIRARLSEAGINIKTGQEMRLADVPVMDEKFGIFSNLHGAVSGAQFANELRAAAQKDYGHAGPLQVQAILGYSAEQLCKEHQKITAVFPASNAQEHRVAEMFGAVALAGEIATRAGIVPWTAASYGDYSESDSVNAAVALFNRWKDNRSIIGTFSSEHSNILSDINDFIERHSQSRFADIDPIPSVTPMGHPIQPPIIRDLAGYWEDTGASRIYLFTKSGLREATKGHDFRRVLKALTDAGAFTAIGSDGEKAKKRRTPDRKQAKLYHIDPEKLE
ncbi:MAG: hypothetical protein DME55_07660 [Verrucomicrobia bacterium]|nr:MAG: hypothetical protein DME55_07660 [Verrucomicrobiota bacterium]